MQKMASIIVPLLLLPLIAGLEIDIDTKDVDTCNHGSRMMKIMCMTSASELGNNQLSITKGPSTVTTCQKNGMNCSKPMDMGYSAMFDGDNVVLKVMGVRYTNNVTTWSCMIGSNKATMKVKLPGHDPCEMKHACFGLNNDQFIIFIVVIAAVIILLVAFLVCCAVCKQGKGSGPRGFCRCNCGRSDEEQKTGYTGKHYDVKTSYHIDDPNHVPDASAKQIEPRTKEAKKACENYGEENRRAATEVLGKYVEDRVPPPESTTMPLLANGDKK